MTVLYVIYLGYQYFYLTPYGKELEMLNECVFVLIQYCFVLLYELVRDEQAREMLGILIIALTSFLLFMNFMVIIVSSIRQFCRKCYLKGLKRRAEKRYKEALKLKKVTCRHIVNANKGEAYTSGNPDDNF